MDEVDDAILRSTNWNSKCKYVACLLEYPYFVGSPVSVLSGFGRLLAMESVFIYVFASLKKCNAV